jgi:hypothetical protein
VSWIGGGVWTPKFAAAVVTLLLAAGCAPGGPGAGGPGAGGSGTGSAGSSRMNAAGSAHASVELAQAYKRGQTAATAALAEGKLKIKEYPPLPSPPGHGEYIALLRERCGVEYESVVSNKPGIDELLVEEVRGWNDVMKPAIQNKFGPDIFTILQKEAQQRLGPSATPAASEPN